MRIGIVGTGVSGMTAAWLLRDDFDIVLFEANNYPGGHTHTVDVSAIGASFAIDTGFIVHNDRTYPNFTRLLERLGVARQPTRMSFSVKCERTGLEYNGTSLNALFAQRRNLLRPSFLRMIADIVRFNRRALAWLERGGDEATLDEFLRAGGYSRAFIEQYIIPMGAAIWSADPARFTAFPARAFLRFFRNHGLLQVRNRPQWFSIVGGSRSYMEVMARPLRDRLRLNAPVQSVRRRADGGVELVARGLAAPERFDQVLIATHSDQALALRGADATERERDILGAIVYQPNDVALHTDTRLLPRCRRAWAAWNYHIPPQPAGRATVTYDMNILQRLEAPETFCVTLNRRDRIAPERILGEFVYEHPVFDAAALRAQQRRSEISGAGGIHYCGAYWGYGFHEDGVRSALDVATVFGKGL